MKETLSCLQHVSAAILTNVAACMQRLKTLCRLYVTPQLHFRCNEMYINDRRRVEGTPGPHASNPPRSQCSPAGSYRRREKRRARWRETVDAATLLIITLLKIITISLNQCKGASCAKLLTTLGYHATWEHLLRHSFLLWESSSLSCLTSRGHVLSLRPVCRMSRG